MVLQKNQFYTITSLKNGLALGIENTSAENGALAQLQEQNGSDGQKWQAVYVDDNWFKLVNKQTGKVLDAMQSGTANGTWLHQWADVNGGSQLWRAEVCGNCCKLVSQKSGRCIDIVAMAAVAGARLQIWDDLGGENQKWTATLIDEITAPVKKPAKAPKTEKTAAAAEKKPAAKAAAKAEKPAAKVEKPAAKAEKPAAKTEKKPAAKAEKPAKAPRK